MRLFNKLFLTALAALGIGSFASAQITGIVESRNSVCYGDKAGFIRIHSVQGGVAPYEFSIDGGNTWFDHTDAVPGSPEYTDGVINYAPGNSPNEYFFFVRAGQYTVQVRNEGDAQSAVVLDNSRVVTLEGGNAEKPWLQASITPFNPSICGDDDGSIFITNANGGTQLNGNGNYQFRLLVKVRTNTTGQYLWVPLVKDPEDYDNVADLNNTVDAMNVDWADLWNKMSRYDINNDVTAPLVSTDLDDYGWVNERVIDGAQNSYRFTDLPADTFRVEMREVVSSWFGVGSARRCVVALNPKLPLVDPAAEMTATVTKENVTLCGLPSGRITISGATGATEGNFDFVVVSAGVPSADSLLKTLGTGSAYNFDDVVDAYNALHTNPSIWGSTYFATPWINESEAFDRDNTEDNFIENGYIFTWLPEGSYDVYARNADVWGCYKKVNAAPLVISQVNSLVATPSVKQQVTYCGAADGIIEVTGITGVTDDNANDGNFGVQLMKRTDAAVATEANVGGSWTTSIHLTSSDSVAFEALGPGVYDVFVGSRYDNTFRPLCIKRFGPLTITEENPISAAIDFKNDTVCGGKLAEVVVTPTANNLTGIWEALLVTADLAPSTPNGSVVGGVTVVNSGWKGEDPSKVDVADSTIKFSQIIGDYTDGASAYAAYRFPVGPGTYDIWLRKGTCTKLVRENLVITGPNTLNATVSKTDRATCGSTDGSIVISNASGSYVNPLWDGVGNNGYDSTGTATPGTDWYNLGLGSVAGAAAAEYYFEIRDTSGAALSPALTGAKPESSAGSRGRTFFDVPPGVYDVWVSDANCPFGCSKKVSQVVITQPNNLSAEVTPIPAATCGGGGTVDVSNIAGGPSDQVYQVLIATAGAFDVTGAGADNVQNHNAPSNNSDQTIYSFVPKPNTWSTGWVNEFEINRRRVNDIPAGVYDVFVRSYNSPSCAKLVRGNRLGQTGRESITITQPQPINAAVAVTNATNCISDDAKITITGATGASAGNQYEFQIVVADSATLESGNSQLLPYPASGWIPELDPADNGLELSRDNFPSDYDAIKSIISGTKVDVWVRDAAFPNCRTLVAQDVIVTVPNNLAAEFAKLDITFCEGNNGEIHAVNPTGATGVGRSVPGYEFQLIGTTYNIVNNDWWQFAPNFTNLRAGTYALWMRDADIPGCTKLVGAPIVLSDDAALNADVAADSTSAEGVSDGRVIVSNAAGAASATYEFQLVAAGAQPTDQDWQAEVTETDNGYTFEGVAKGSYTVWIREVSKPEVCIISKSIVVGGPVSVDAALNAVRFNVYPNPNNGTFTVAASKEAAGATLTVTNLVGQTLLTKTVDATSIEVSINEVPAGIYMVTVRNADASYTAKIVKR